MDKTARVDDIDRVLKKEKIEGEKEERKTTTLTTKVEEKRVESKVEEEEEEEHERKYNEFYEMVKKRFIDMKKGHLTCDCSAGMHR